MCKKITNKWTTCLHQAASRLFICRTKPARSAEELRSVLRGAPEASIQKAGLVWGGSMLQHHPQSHKNSFHCMIKRKQRACPCFQRSKFSWRHALQSWVGTELGAAAPWLAAAQAQSKRRTVLAASEAGPSAAPAGGACLGGQQLRACMLKHLQVLPASGRWRGGQWLAGLVLLQGGDAGAEQARWLTL